MDKKDIILKYKFRKPKLLENDVFIIFAPRKIILKPGEIINVNTEIEIYLPKFIEGTFYLLNSHINEGLRLLNSNYISQINNRNIEIEQIYKNGIDMPPWNLTLTLENKLLTQPLMIKKGMEIGFLNFYNIEGRIKYKFQKKH